MKNASPIRIVGLTLIVVCLVLFLSTVSVKIWGGKSEKSGDIQTLVISPTMTIAEFGAKNNIEKPVLKKIFGLKNKQDMMKVVSATGLELSAIAEKSQKVIALELENQSKNWVKIPLKFCLWILFLCAVFVWLKSYKITPFRRKLLYAGAIFVFGIALGADPGAMGTVKDAIALYGSKGVVFKPRMIALTLFLTLVFFANKFICGWGCQAGTLQDLIFRLNRNTKDTKGVFGQYKPPFVVSNAVRVLFFLAFTMIAFQWSTDIIDPIDPFKVFKPEVLTLWGWLSLGVLLLTSLFVYRPWCVFFCPFGLVGWLVEKVSVFKIQVDYETCISCKACEKACPTTVMGAILKRNRVIPDCFSCGSCIGACPTNSIEFKTGRRMTPPAGKFD